MSDRTENIHINHYINNAQAQAALNEQQKEYAKLRDEQKKLAVGTKEWIAKQKEINQVTQKMVDFRKSIDVSSMSLKQLVNHSKTLRNIQQHLIPGTKEAKQLAAELRKVDARITEVKTGLGPFGQMWKRIGTEIKAFGVLALGALGIQALVGKISNLIQQSAQLADSWSNVRKTTGLTQEAVEELSKELGKIDTRTSRKELLDLAATAGKMNITGSAAIKKFVEEADQIKVALGEDLGEDAILQISKMSKTFNTNMLNIASAVNTVGASSEAAEQYLVDISARLGPVAKLAKIAAPDILGYGAALDIAGLQAEMSATALNGFFIDFVKNTGKFEKAAGMATGSLSKLIGEKGTNEGFLAFLDALKAASKGEGDFLQRLEQVGIDGARGSQVFLSLSNNIKTVREQQDIANKSFAEGTSVTEEFNIRNQNLAAQIDKLQKWINKKFVSSEFMKFLERGVNWLSKLTKDTETQQDQLKKINSELNAEFEILKKANFTQEQRARAIQEINTKYAEYLPHLIDEKATLQDIEKIQQEVNKNMLKRIVFLDYEEEIKKILKEQKQSAEALYYAQKKAAELKGPSDMSPEQNSAQKQQTENMIALNQFMVDDAENKTKDVERKYKGLADNLGLIWDEITSAFEKTSGESTDTVLETVQAGSEEAKKEAKDTEKDVNASLRRLAELKKKVREAIAQQDAEFAEEDRINAERKERAIAEMRVMVSKTGSKEKLQAEIALMQLEKDLELNNTELLEEEKALIEEKFRQAKLAAEEAYEQKKYQKVVDIAERAFDEIGTLVNNFTTVRTNKENAAFDQYIRNNDIQRLELQNRLEQGIISQEKYNEKIAALDKEQAQKKYELDVAQFEREQKMAVTMAIIQGALGVVNAWSSGSWIENIIESAAIVAITAAEVATIESQPPPVAPVFRYGKNTGQVAKGPSHENGGIGLYANGKKVGEMEGDEAIIPVETVDANANIVSALLANYGKRLSVQDLTGPLPVFNYSRATENVRMEKGGFLSGVNRTTTIDEGVQRWIRQAGSGEKDSYKADKDKYSSAMLATLNRNNQLLMAIERKTGISLFDLERAQNDKVITEDLNRMK